MGGCQEAVPYKELLVDGTVRSVPLLLARLVMMIKSLRNFGQNVQFYFIILVHMTWVHVSSFDIWSRSFSHEISTCDTSIFLRW